MKRIPSYYWDLNYKNVQEPNDLERAWVQLWLELTDPASSIEHLTPCVNTPILLEELLQWKPQNSAGHPQDRTLFYLLLELDFQTQVDKALEFCLSSAELNDFRSAVKKLKQTFNIYYDWSGKPYDSKTIKSILTSHLIPLFRMYCKLTSIKSPCGNLSHSSNACSLFNFVYDTLQSDKRYLAAHFDYLQRLFSLYSNTGDSALFNTVEPLTRSLLTELAVRENYSLAYLKRQCLHMFLRPINGQPFNQRFSQFFANILRPQQKYTVFMRIQAGKVLHQTGEIGRISFATNVDEYHSEISKLITHTFIDFDQGEKAKNFFFGPTKNLMTYAIVKDVSAEDPGRAVFLALSFLDQALRRAKFEYELQGFSIDNQIYLLDQERQQLLYFTKRQAERNYRGASGSVSGLEELLLSISTAENNRAVPPEMVERTASFALHWHQIGLETKALESKYLSHWFGLEQLFTLRRKEIHKRTASADKLVLALAFSVRDNMQLLPWYDLRGDLQRCTNWANAPIVAKSDGIVRFNRTLEMIQRYQRLSTHVIITPEIFFKSMIETNEPPKITIHSQHDMKLLQTITLEPNTLLFCDQHDAVEADQWIGGLAWVSEEVNPALQKLYNDHIPDIERLCYVFICSRYQSGKLADHVNNCLDQTKKTILTQPIDTKSLFQCAKIFLSIEVTLQRYLEYLNKLPFSNELPLLPVPPARLRSDPVSLYYLY